MFLKVFFWLLSALMENSDSNTSQRLNEHDYYNNDPLCLQSSYHLGAQIVNIKLTGLNFQNWSKYVKMALRTKGKLGFIDGTCTRPCLLYTSDAADE